MRFLKSCSLLGILALLAFFQACDKDDEVNPSQNESVSIPNAVFKQILLDNSAINTNGDSIIQTSEAEVFTGAIVAIDTTINDVTGIESFPNITRLALYGNEIESIDVSKNTKLTQLLLEENELTSIDISKNIALTDFKAHSNEITRANVANGNNSNMIRMELNGNSSLTCIQTDAGFTPPVKGWGKDSNANYSSDCN